MEKIDRKGAGVAGGLGGESEQKSFGKGRFWCLVEGEERKRGFF